MSLGENKRIFCDLCTALEVSTKELFTNIVQSVDDSGYLSGVQKVSEDLSRMGKFVHTLPDLPKPFLGKLNLLKNILVAMVQEMKGIHQQNRLGVEQRNLLLFPIYQKFLMVLEIVRSSIDTIFGQAEGNNSGCFTDSVDLNISNYYNTNVPVSPTV
eukprot:TRINITY_DN5183_c0_g1_i6.p1 TRINITY_DN5183_c0_g1~~TRINITY_DN5183_c0_g1_i6.p1  ORF type:complete len:157 (-),score=29.57 TRINITY_DN5183_c0_g1_i6:473-943(-)